MIELTPGMLTLWSLLLTGYGAVMAWLTNRIFKMLDDLRQEDSLLHKRVTDAEKESAETYARRDDLKDMTQQILTAVRRLEDKIDKKADR